MDCTDFDRTEKKLLQWSILASCEALQKREVLLRTIAILGNQPPHDGGPIDYMGILLIWPQYVHFLLKILCCYFFASSHFQASQAGQRRQKFRLFSRYFPYIPLFQKHCKLSSSCKCQPPSDGLKYSILTPKDWAISAFSRIQPLFQWVFYL